MKHLTTLLTIGALTAPIAACDKDMGDMDYTDTGMVTTMPGDTIDEDVDTDTGDDTDTGTVGTATGATAADGGADTTAMDTTTTSTIAP